MQAALERPTQHEVVFRLTAREMFRLTTLRGLARRGFVAGWALAVAGSLVLLLSGGAGAHTGAIALAVAVGSVAWVMARGWRAARRAPMVLAPAVLRFDEHAVELETGWVQATYAWSCFDRRWARRGIACLEIAGTRVVLPVPLRAFDDAGWVRFAALAGIPVG